MNENMFRVLSQSTGLSEDTLLKIANEDPRAFQELLETQMEQTAMDEQMLSLLSANTGMSEEELMMMAQNDPESFQQLVEENLSGEEFDEEESGDEPGIGAGSVSSNPAGFDQSAYEEQLYRLSKTAEESGSAIPMATGIGTGIGAVGGGAAGAFGGPSFIEKLKTTDYVKNNPAVMNEFNDMSNSFKRVVPGGMGAVLGAGVGALGGLGTGALMNRYNQADEADMSDMSDAELEELMALEQANQMQQQAAYEQYMLEKQAGMWENIKGMPRAYWDMLTRKNVAGPRAKMNDMEDYAARYGDEQEVYDTLPPGYDAAKRNLRNANLASIGTQTGTGLALGGAGVGGYYALRPEEQAALEEQAMMQQQAAYEQYLLEKQAGAWDSIKSAPAAYWNRLSGADWRTANQRLKRFKKDHSSDDFDDVEWKSRFDENLNELTDTRNKARNQALLTQGLTGAGLAGAGVGGYYALRPEEQAALEEQAMMQQQAAYEQYMLEKQAGMWENVKGVPSAYWNMLTRKNVAGPRQEVEDINSLINHYKNTTKTGDPTTIDPYYANLLEAANKKLQNANLASIGTQVGTGLALGGAGVGGYYALRPEEQAALEEQAMMQQQASEEMLYRLEKTAEESDRSFLSQAGQVVGGIGGGLVGAGTGVIGGGIAGGLAASPLVGAGLIAENFGRKYSDDDINSLLTNYFEKNTDYDQAEVADSKLREKNIAARVAAATEADKAKATSMFSGGMRGKRFARGAGLTGIVGGAALGALGGGAVGAIPGALTGRAAGATASLGADAFGGMMGAGYDATFPSKSASYNNAYMNKIAESFGSTVAGDTGAGAGWGAGIGTGIGAGVGGLAGGVTGGALGLGALGTAALPWGYLRKRDVPVLDASGAPVLEPIMNEDGTPKLKPDGTPAMREAVERKRVGKWGVKSPRAWLYGTGVGALGLGAIGGLLGAGAGGLAGGAIGAPVGAAVGVARGGYNALSNKEESQAQQAAMQRQAAYEQYLLEKYAEGEEAVEPNRNFFQRMGDGGANIYRNLMGRNLATAMQGGDPAEIEAMRKARNWTRGIAGGAAGLGAAGAGAYYGLRSNPEEAMLQEQMMMEQQAALEEEWMLKQAGMKEKLKGFFEKFTKKPVERATKESEDMSFYVFQKNNAKNLEGMTLSEQKKMFEEVKKEKVDKAKSTRKKYIAGAAGAGTVVAGGAGAGAYALSKKKEQGEEKEATEISYNSILKMAEVKVHTSEESEREYLRWFEEAMKADARPSARQ